MLARSSSDAGNRLRRSKSTSTVHRHPPPVLEPLDPDTAQRHALAAATAAFQRAREPEAKGRTEKRSSEVSRSKSNASKKSLSSQGSHFPPRESSLRSVHPQRGGQTSSAARQSRAPTMNTEKFPPFYPAPDSGRLLSAQPSVTFNENVRPNTQPKSHRQSASSSVTSQQIRKARSMYYASSVQTGSPIARPPAKYLTTPPPLNMSPAPESLSGFLQVPRSVGPSPLASPRLPVAVGPDETLDKARDKYLQNFQQRQVKHKPSLFLAPFKKRQERSKKKERPPSAAIMPVSSDVLQTSNGTSFDEHLDEFGMPKQKKEKRSISNSLKDKFKRVFRRTSRNSPTLPVQQIEATRDYFSYQPGHLEPPVTHDSGSEVPSPDHELLQRIRSRTPSLEILGPYPPRPTSRGSNRSARSNRSLHSEINATLLSNSRVTSWADSSAGNTLTQRDIKRLTVIHEAKDSIGSEAERNMAASVKRKSLPPLSAFRDPMPMESFLEQTSMPVDPKRVFSALMKEIDASKGSQPGTSSAISSPGTESDVFVSSATKELCTAAARELGAQSNKEFQAAKSSKSKSATPQCTDGLVTNLKPSSSLKSFGRTLKSTIRAVTPTEQRLSPLPDRTTSVRGAVRIPKPDVDASSSTTSSDCDEAHTFGSINFKMGTARGRKEIRGPKTGHIVTPNTHPQKWPIERSNEQRETLLDESHTPRLPRPRNATYSVTNITNETRTLAALPGTTDPATPLELESEIVEPKSPNRKAIPHIPRSPTPPPRPLFSPLSPSVYSRNTDGISILPNDSVVSLDGANDNMPHHGGSAVIITSGAVKSYVIGTPTRQHGVDSARSSRDWKAWLSHEVEELARTSPRPEFTISEEYTPSPGHRREFTQIEDEEEEDTTVILRPSTDIRVLLQGSSTVESTEACEALNVSKSAALPPMRSGPTLTSSKEEQGHGQDCEDVPSVTQPPIATSSLSTSPPSQGSSGLPPRVETPSSARMNERFPFINTGRRSSSSSLKDPRKSRSTTNSGSSSLRSKATPPAKLYSDFSVPQTKRPSQHDQNIRLRSTAAVDEDQENRKENIPSLQHKAPDSSSLQSSAPAARPKSMRPLSSMTLNRQPTSITQYTTTSLDTIPISAQGSSASKTSPSRPRIRAQLRPISPVKLTTRPKSAYDLRTTNTPPLAPSPLRLSRPGSESPTRYAVDPIKPSTSQQRREQPCTPVRSTAATDDDALRRILESPRAGSGTKLGLRSSPPTSTGRVGGRRLHVKHSSSTLALNKEPSPGAEERVIDAVLDGKASPGKGGSGRVTPGQRLAERFLKERESMTMINAHGAKRGTILEREDTPAFL